MSRAEVLMAELLEELGWSADDEMAATPKKAVELLTTFAANTEAPEPTWCVSTSSAPVALRGFPFYSLCVHHLVPFFGTVSLAYVPRGRIAGFGWFARLVQHYSRRPQLQERLADELASAVFDGLQAKAVVVRVVARQLCLELSTNHPPAEVVVLVTRGNADDRLMGLVGGMDR